MEFQQSRTYANLQIAYEAELMACSQYLIYGDRARDDNYIEIGNAFDVISRNSKEHARIWLRQMNEGILPSTSEFLLSASQEESYFGNEMYRDFAAVAKEEGFDDIAALFSGVANIDLNHSLEFRTYYELLERNELLCKPTETLWICMQCGNILSGICAPEICPVCGFPQGYYRLYTPTPSII